MRIIFHILIIVFTFSNIIYPQSSNWQKVYKSPTNYHIYGHDICASGSDYFILSDNADPSGVYIFKINSNGDTLLSRFFSNKTGAAIVSTSSGDIVFVGRNTGTSYKMSLTKCNSNGETTWIKNYDSTEYSDVRDLMMTFDSSFVTCGKINYDGFVTKCDYLGNMVWKRKFVGSYNMNLYNVIQSNQGDGYFVCGTVRENQNSIVEGLVIKLDTAGNELWRKKYVSPYNPEGMVDLKMTAISGGYFLCAETSSTEFARVILVCSKINEYGDTLYWRCYPMSPGYDYYISSIKRLQSNKLVFLYYRSRYMVDTLISGAFVTDTSGVVFSSTEFSSTKYIYLTRAYVYNSQNIFFVGSSNHIVDYKKNIYVVKTDSLLYAPPVNIRFFTYSVPKQFYLSQNFPNPFNTFTRIYFGVSKRDYYQICVYNLAGKRIDKFLTKILQPGEYIFNLNMSKFASGVYFYTLESDVILETKKLVLLK